MQNLVSRKNDAIDVTALGTGLETAEHHGQSVIGLTEVASHLPIQHMKTEQGEQLEVQVDDENNDNPKDWIYQALENEHECELETVVHVTPSVKGRLKEHITFWIKLYQEGYKIPFIEIPPVAYLRNNKSASRHKDFV